MIRIYTDGAYSPSRNQGGWAYVVVENGEEIDRDLDAEMDTTNNRMEIMAVIKAVEFVNKYKLKDVIIVSDSMYVIGTITLGWSKKKNTDLWDILFNSLKGVIINWEHVKGHNGDKWNEHCDMLAVHASKLILKESE